MRMLDGGKNRSFATDPSEMTTARLYRVQEGEDLRAIAAHFYGRPELWSLIYHFNRSTLERGLRAGQILCIPDL